MTLCPVCESRDVCREICPALKKQITGRGITASRKPKTYPVDFSYIENPSQPHNSFQLEVLNTLTKLTFKAKENLVTKLELEEAINQSLNRREKNVILLFMQNLKQNEIAKRLNISQPRVNFILQRAIRKLKIYLKGL